MAVGCIRTAERDGSLADINRFDANYFDIKSNHANNMDPALRILLEVVYEAIFDSRIIYSLTSL